MNEYKKGSIFTFEVGEKNEVYTVIETTSIADANYILAIPVEKQKDKIITFPREMVAFKTYDDGTVSVEDDEAIVSQIVHNLLPKKD